MDGSARAFDEVLNANRTPTVPAPAPRGAGCIRDDSRRTAAHDAARRPMRREAAR